MQFGTTRDANPDRPMGELRKRSLLTFAGYALVGRLRVLPGHERGFVLFLTPDAVDPGALFMASRPGSWGYSVQGQINRP